MPNKRLCSVAAVLAIVLSGCAIQPAGPDIARVERSLATAFELDGRLSASDGARAASGRLLWHHAPQRDEWTFLSPLGQIVAKLTSTPGSAILRTADGQRVQAPDADSMLPELLGVSAPVDGLRYWVQATPRAGARVLRVDEIGRPSRISDDGWIIDYPAYADASPEAPPRRVDVHRGDAGIRLILDEWSPHP